VLVPLLWYLEASYCVLLVFQGSLSVLGSIQSFLASYSSSSPAKPGGGWLQDGLDPEPGGCGFQEGLDPELGGWFQEGLDPEFGGWFQDGVDPVPGPGGWFQDGLDPDPGGILPDPTGGW